MSKFWFIGLENHQSEIQSGLNTFDESRAVITFLTKLGDAGILCSFRLYLKEKAGKKIP